MRSLRAWLFLLASPLAGNGGRRLLARWLLGAQVAADARIGLCLIDAGTIRLGAGTRIGHFSVFRNLDELVLEPRARIGTFNWVFGARGGQGFGGVPSRRSALVLRDGASVTSRHILDCTDMIEIQRFATVAGFRSQILTHSIDIRRNCQSCAPVRIGAYSFIGTGAVLLKGAAFPARSVLSAGSVFSGSGEGSFRIYAGVPAGAVKDLPPDSAYMAREDPIVR